MEKCSWCGELVEDSPPNLAIHDKCIIEHHEYWVNKLKEEGHEQEMDTIGTFR